MIAHALTWVKCVLGISYPIQNLTRLKTDFKEELNMETKIILCFLLELF